MGRMICTKEAREKCEYAFMCEENAEVADDSECADLIVKTEVEKRPRVYLFGAGHVGKALAAALSALPFRVILVDFPMFLSYVPPNMPNADLKSTFSIASTKSKMSPCAPQAKHLNPSG